jgi:hypothetical protein
MLTLTEAAGAHLAKMLVEAEAAYDVAVRIVRVPSGWTLRKDSAVPGDATLDHEGRTVLMLDEQVSAMLSDKTVDVENGEDGPKFALF